MIYEQDPRAQQRGPSIDYLKLIGLLWPEIPNIETAIATLRRLETDKEVQGAIATIQRVLGIIHQVKS